MTSRALHLTAALLVVASSVLSGCTPTCSQACQKLSRCGLNLDVQRSECVAACDKGIDAYTDTANDKEGRRTFNAARRCIGSSSCDELKAGACYDADLFPFAAEP